MNEFIEQLRATLNISERVAEQLAEICGDVAEAREYAKHDFVWTECHSEEYNRPYYHPKGSPGTTWDPPKSLIFDEISLDSDMFNLPIALCLTIFHACHRLMSHNDDRPDRKTHALELLQTVLQNVIHCDNQEPKFRVLKMSNEKLRDGLLNVTGGTEILRAAGFCVHGDQLVLDEGAGSLPAVQCTLARVLRLLTGKGHTGGATSVRKRTGPAARDPGPGFEYQTEVFWCTGCQKPINDGTTRLRMKSYDAPRGEHRFRCLTCADAGTTCDLCQDCYGTLAKEATAAADGDVGAGVCKHPRGHVFEGHPPRERLHNLGPQAGQSARNPWGNAMSGGSVGRARDRLKERTGL